MGSEMCIRDSLTFSIIIHFSHISNLSSAILFNVFSSHLVQIFSSWYCANPRRLHRKNSEYCAHCNHPGNHKQGECQLKTSIHCTILKYNAPCFPIHLVRLVHLVCSVCPIHLVHPVQPIYLRQSKCTPNWSTLGVPKARWSYISETLQYLMFNNSNSI